MPTKRQAYPRHKPMRIANNIATAYRCAPPFDGAPRGRTAAQKLGLTYERAVWKALRNLPCVEDIEHTPWFGFSDASGGALCSPDFLLWHEDGCLIVVEVKLTWIPDALIKLRELYIPVITHAYDGDVCAHPLVIVKSLTPNAPRAAATVEAALQMPSSTLHWLGRGPILW